MASPIVSSTAKSLKVIPSLVINSPWEPDFCFLNDKIVLSIPAPEIVTLSTSKDKPSSNSYTPSDKKISLLGSAKIKASCSTS